MEACFQKSSFTVITIVSYAFPASQDVVSDAHSCGVSFPFHFSVKTAKAMFAILSNTASNTPAAISHPLHPAAGHECTGPSPSTSPKSVANSL